MRWAWKLGKVAGIDVYIHATFLFIIAWVALASFLESGTATGVVAGVAFILALFVCVVLHEFGHALTARRFGIVTRDITLWPIGGVASLERMPDDPRQELQVALAGPAVSLALALALYAWATFSGEFLPANQLTLVTGSFIGRLAVANFFLAAFNVLPAFPMDGGRALRALLAMRTDYVRATQTAASIGQAMAFLFGFVGIFTNPFLVLIAFFIWMGAGQEAAAVQQRSALAGIPVTQAMITDFRSLSPRDSISRAVEVIVSGWQHDFPVLEEERVVGILTRNDLLVALGSEGPHVLVGNVMQRDIQTVEASLTLEQAAQRLETCRCTTMPVMRSGALVGLLTMDNLGEFVLIRQALARARGAGQTASLRGETNL
jgi:Zn-dependent protease/CBS domain-containing protein